MHPPDIILIAAIGKNRELGRGSALIWMFKADLKRFKELTTGHPIIMGRKTFESIGRPLPNRTNIVLTRDTAWSAPGVTVAHSIDEALKVASAVNEKVFVIGGGEIYTLALPFATRLELTLVDAEDPTATAFFPPYDDFKEVKKENPVTEDGITYQWVTFERA